MLLYIVYIRIRLAKETYIKLFDYLIKIRYDSIRDVQLIIELYFLK